MKKSVLFLFVYFLANALTAQTRYIHVVVALCDNKNQGIVPVPKAIGNGQDPKNNLYWGCGYGVKTFMKKQSDWIFLKQINNPTEDIYERLVFKHMDSLVYMVADAYNGAEIKQTITDFFKYSAGQLKQEITLGDDRILLGGNANLICYVGHDGLMEFSLDTFPEKSDEKKREVVILACASKSYFSEPLQKTGAIPLVWTTNLMCPEAYTLDAIIDSWILRESPATTEEKAAQTYNEYQKCGIKGARNLFTTGYQ
jgi:hypothetical protein